jgi:hypothetical protein
MERMKETGRLLDELPPLTRQLLLLVGETSCDTKGRAIPKIDNLWYQR